MKVTLDLSTAQLRLLVEALDYFEADIDNGPGPIALGWTSAQWRAFRLASIRVRTGEKR